MDKEDLKRIVSNPDFIPGIFNYCDRWCERCPYTTRCANFAISEDQFSDTDSHDMNNTKFWEKLNEIFQTTIDMIKEDAKEAGIDLDDIDLSKTDADEERKSEKLMEHECAVGAREYARIVKEWFEGARDLIRQKEEELNLKAELDLLEADPKGESIEINDAIEVIQWYHLFLFPKIMRALDQNPILTEEDEEIENYDSNGSAKIALIAMDRSIAAWGSMYRFFPEQEDEILEILLHLDHLRTMTEKEFPKARDFVRPGFDE